MSLEKRALPDGRASVFRLKNAHDWQSSYPSCAFLTGEPAALLLLSALATLLGVSAAALLGVGSLGAALLVSLLAASALIILLRCTLAAFSSLAGRLIRFLITSLFLSTLALSTRLGSGRGAGSLGISALFISVFRHRYILHGSFYEFGGEIPGWREIW